MIARDLTLIGEVKEVDIKHNSIMLGDSDSDFIIFFNEGPNVGWINEGDTMAVSADISGRFSKFKITGKSMRIISKGGNNE